MTTTSLICGCKHNERAWTVECEAHKAEHAGYHGVKPTWCQRRESDKFEPLKQNEDLR